MKYALALVWLLAAASAAASADERANGCIDAAGRHYAEFELIDLPDTNEPLEKPPSICYRGEIIPLEELPVCGNCPAREEDQAEEKARP